MATKKNVSFYYSINIVSIVLGREIMESYMVGLGVYKGRLKTMFVKPVLVVKG